NVEPAHLRAAVSHASSSGEVARVLDCSRQSRKEIGVERKDAFGLAEIVDGVNRLTKRHNGSGPNIVAVCGFILMPLGLRKLCEDCFELCRQCRRGYRLCQETQSSALFRPLFIQGRAEITNKCRPSSGFVSIKRAL